MKDPSRPRPPVALRVAFALVYVLIGARIFLIVRTMRAKMGHFIDGVSGERFELLQMLGDGPLVPGSFGSPLLFLLLIPVVIVARRLMRRGHRWAAGVLIVYLALRLLMIAVRGPYSLAALGLALLTGLTLGLLLWPGSRRWFDEVAAWRTSSGSSGPGA